MKDSREEHDHASPSTNYKSEGQQSQGLSVSAKDNPCLMAALAYARLGWPVFPVHTPTATGGCSCHKVDCTSIGKHPRTPHGLHDATTDEAAIMSYGDKWRKSNIGICTGAVSGLVVLDIDPDKGGEVVLLELEAGYGSLPATVTQTTGRPYGQHLLFAHPGEGIYIPSRPLADGLDLKADGGYIVAAPSLHASGRRYAWKAEYGPDEMQLELLPDWLLALTQAAEPQRDIHQMSNEGVPIPEGQRNATLTSLAGTMRRRGMTSSEIFAALREVNQARCVPPLPDGEVIIIAESVARYAPEADAHQAGQNPAAGTPRGLCVQSARTLVEKDIPAVRWVVRDLIPEGLTLLAGASKIGKSWAALELGLAVAKGTRLFRYFDTEQGSVLYLALEDGQRRMQGRLAVVLDDVAPENLGIIYDCPMMPDLLQELGGWMSQTPDTRLIIVDVLSKIQQRATGNKNAYHADYDAVAPLQHFALEHGIGIVAVTHTNQRNEKDLGDVLHSVQGTTGIIGCADTVLLLRRARQGSEGRLDVISRDIPEGSFDISFEEGLWVITGRYSASGPGPQPTAREAAIAFLQTVLADGPQPATVVATQAEAQGITQATLRRAKGQLGVTDFQQNRSHYWKL